MIEQPGFLTGRSYELIASDGAVLGYLTEHTSAGAWFFGGAAASTFVLEDARGGLVASMYRPGTLSRFQFIVTDADDVEAGLVEQENTFFAPEFELRSSDGPVMRLTGGSFGSTEWELVDAADENRLYGRVSLEFAGLSGMFSGTQRFAVRLGPALSGSARLLALMATVCLDYVRDTKRRN